MKTTYARTIVAAILAAGGLTLLLWGVPVATQVSQNQLIYGQNAGTVRAVAVDATGKLLIGATGDPCLDANVAKASVVINIASATTTNVVALSGTTITYVCGFIASMVGTAPSIQFEYGTGATCGTGTTVLTGTFLPTAGTLLSLVADGTEFKTAAANGLCIVSAGTGPSIQGVLTYVQQ